MQIFSHFFRIFTDFLVTTPKLPHRNTLNDYLVINTLNTQKKQSEDCLLVKLVHK